jgi:hypothetical protein
LRRLLREIDEQNPPDRLLPTDAAIFDRAVFALEAVLARLREQERA